MDIRFENGGDYGSNSFAAGLDRVRLYEEIGSEYSGFKRESAADVTNAGPMATIAAAVTMALESPKIVEDNKPDVDNVTHMQATIVAAQINDPKAQLIGSQWNHSEMARTDKFFDGQQNAQDKNNAKLEDTENAGVTLAEGRRALMGAAQDIKVDKYNAQMGSPGENAGSVAGGKPSAAGIATGAAIGHGMATVADMFIPGAGAPIRAVSTATTGIQSAALAFGGSDGPSDKYDRPRSKAEAKEKSDSYFTTSSPGSNPYDGTTAGAAIASVLPSANKSAFGDAAAPAADPVMDMKSTQIRMLEEAAGKLFDAENEQASMHMQATEADDAHTEYLESGGADFDTHELFRAADHGAMSDVQQTALIHAARAENPDVIEKIEERFELKDLDLSMGGGGSVGAGPKLA